MLGGSKIEKFQALCLLTSVVVIVTGVSVSNVVEGDAVVMGIAVGFAVFNALSIGLSVVTITSDSVSY